METTPTIFIAIALALCIFCQWLAWRVRLPAIIFLLIAGILIGPVSGLLDPELLLGDLFFPYVSLSVAIILFEGSLTLRFREISGLQKVVRNMVSIGMLVTWLITSIAARYAIDLSWQIALLFGAITVVSGPTVIAPLLRTVRPTSSIANILRWEGIVIDPIGASLAVLVYEFIISGGAEAGFGHSALTFAKLILVGAVIGAVCAYLFGEVLRKHWLPEFLHNVATLALVVIAYILSNQLQPESGLVTVTVMGIWLANTEDLDMEEILNFKESISVLLISLLFIMLAARLDLTALMNLGWRTILLFIAIQFLARPLNIMVSAAGSSLSWPERNLLAWIAPRGIVAAAISALFAVQLENAGYSDAALIVPLTFFVIIATVVVQSLTARPLARWLGVAEPDPKGFLIIGANQVARAISWSLMENGVRVMLADTSWDNVSKAKIIGLPTYYGNAYSEHAEWHLDMSGIGRLLAMAAYEDMNVSALMHYRLDLGRSNLFILQTKQQEMISERRKMPRQNQGQILFGPNVTFSSLSLALAQGAQIHSTKLTEQFGYEEFLNKHGKAALPLFAIDEKKKVYVYSDNEQTFEPKNKWTLIYLQGPRAEGKRREEAVEQLLSQKESNGTQG